MSNAPAVQPATAEDHNSTNHYFPALESIISGLTMRFREEIQYTKYGGIEEYLISVINGQIGVYPDPQPVCDRKSGSGRSGHFFQIRFRPNTDRIDRISH